MDIRLLHDRVNVYPLEEVEMRLRGVLISDTATQQPQPNEVSAGGSGRTEGELMRMARELETGDHDVHKGAMEDERPSATTNAPGLDDNGLPNDQTAIAQDALGAREDGSQG